METKNPKMMLDDIKKAWDIDQPQTAISKFNEACDLFVKDKDYKDLLVLFKKCLPMADMLADAITEIIVREERAISECEGEPLMALYHVMKGKYLRLKRYWDENVDHAFLQAMSHPDKLEIPLKEFDWFLNCGEFPFDNDDELHIEKDKELQVVYDKNNHPIFGHDLLSYIVYETRQYDLLAKYHQDKNSDAICYAQCMQIIRHRSDEEKELSELVDKYKDTPVSLFALEALIDNHLISYNRYNTNEKRNMLASKSMEHILSIMERFPQWYNLGITTKLIERLTEPEVDLHIEKEVLLPFKPYSFTLLRKNISHVVLSIYRSNIQKRNGRLNLRSEYVEKSFEVAPVYQKEYDYEAGEKHLWMSSEMEIAPLASGLYKLVMRVDGKICCAVKIRVSQLCMLGEFLPDNKKRLAVLDAATGVPVPNAFIRLTTENKNVKSQILNCDETGEIIDVSNYKDIYLYPFTKDDQWAEDINMYRWDSYSYDKMKSRDTGDILTDRSIYRPGQTVHISIVGYHVDENNLVRTIQHRKGKINFKKEYERNIIWQDKVKTDEYGVGQIDYRIPEDFAPGNYEINWGNCSTTIKVEEYKRPTFEVKLEPYTSPYKMGDTIVIRGKATSFAGVPIVNAKVNFETNTEVSYWFFHHSRYWGIGRDTFMSIREHETEGETVTDQEGIFQFEIPLVVDDGKSDYLKNNPLFLDITIYADVVDVTGETQYDAITLPFSNREQVLYAEMEKKIEKSEDVVFIPFVKNMMGKTHQCEVRYQLDDGEWQMAESGKKIILDDVEVGKHVLRLEYDGEQMEHEFLLFDRGSTCTPCETDCWEYQSSMVFPMDGSPVVIQVGDSTPGTYILFDIFSGEQHIDSGAIKTETGMIRWELPYEEKYGNGILVNFVWVRNQEVQHCSMAIRKPIPEMKLNLNWLSWKDDYTPGSHMKWLAKIANPDGQLVPSNMVAVIYDKALDQLHPHSWKGFGPELDWNIPDTDWKYAWISSIRHNWRANESPYDDSCEECICCGSAPTSGGSHKRGRRNSISTPSEDGQFDEIKNRSNFAETAYFATSLHTNDKGEIEIEFDLPDTLTTWKLMVVAFTQDMHWCYIEREFISKKELMLTANMPRFMRVGDKSTISAKVTNQSGKDMEATVRLELLDSKSQKLLFCDSMPREISDGSTVTASFHFKPDEEVDQYVCRVFAQCEACSDGEERIIPVLPDKTMVTTTHVFDQDGPGSYLVHPSGLFPVGTTHHQLLLDYTNNALWLAVKTMKGLVKYDKDNAISLTVALYSALLTLYLKKEVIGESDEVISGKEMDSLMGLFGKLEKLQNLDGGFSWYKGMPSSEYITTEVLMHLSRLSAIVKLPVDLADMMENGFCFVDKEMHRRVQELRKLESKGIKVSMPCFTMLQHLYNNALSGRTITREDRDDYDYLVNLMLRDIHQQTIYEKAMSTIILERVGKKELALEYVESLCQYTEFDEARGRSFKTSRATYSWYSYKIPTHVAAMEAIHRLCPNRRQEIIEMQKWLLNEKRTQTWETPIDSVNAVHALLFGNIDVLYEGIATAITIDGKMLECEMEGKEGHLQTELDKDTQLISFDKKSKGMSWGAVYANFLQPLSEVSASGSGMTIKREILSSKNELHVGDRITIRLTYTCDRNYDMVEVIDSKAACMEPVNQLSWNDSFKHVAPYDTKTVISYYGLAEGTYSMETEFWLDRPGIYEIGLATIQCAYAPEFRATCPSQKLVVLP